MYFLGLVCITAVPEHSPLRGCDTGFDRFSSISPNSMILIENPLVGKAGWKIGEKGVP
jgi:hypothetical protein